MKRACGVKFTPSGFRKAKSPPRLSHLRIRIRASFQFIDGDQINAEDAWTHYVERLGWDSAGVVSVSVGDCIRESLDVAVDPTLFPEHVLIDFNAHTSKNKRKTIGKKLTSIARERGWVYVP